MFNKINNWICLTFVSIIIFTIFLIYIWNFTVDDAYITFRYALHIAQGQGIVWNVGESPVEGYTNLLWVIFSAVLIKLNMNPVLFTKIIGLGAVIGILYFYWKIAIDFFDDKKLYFAAFAVASAFLLINPATAIHAVSGLETAFYSFMIMLIMYASYNLIILHKRKYLYIFAIASLLISLLRPEGIIISLSLFIFTLVLFKIKNKYSLSFYIPFVLIYLVPLVGYMIFRINYFNETFPLPFYVKAITYGEFLAILNGLSFIHVIPFILVILLSILLIKLVWNQKSKIITKYYYLLAISLIIIISANVIYIQSAPIMNYAQRFFYPSFVLMYLLSSISIVILFKELKSLSKIRLESIKYAFCILLIIINLSFINDIQYDHFYGERLSAAHIALGESLNSFSGYNYTIASVDAGAIPYFSRWNHLDTVGLNDKFIAKNKLATQEYLEKKEPELVLIISNSSESITHYPPLEQPFLEFVQRKNYVQLAPIKFVDDYYLIPFLNPNVNDFEKISYNLQKVSECSLKN